MNRLLVWLLRGYQLMVSPMLGQNCRFYPTCSNYAVEAVQLHGAARGSWLALRRVCRCHPWNDGGVDLVPRPGEQSPPTACGCKHS
ncbi:membrane protein insertion efficiency factor YidD [Massilia sp. YIM B02763]|uniref:membrane protein insertion efficiency factor YidD n=1 Tax=Massilia sp. YIM B02763 TaxID=3050130 RepID=UPI0025B69E94|nr:membrane protein insertion efficiency factor YidD [Massilia sp. YIM B02763]MDN4053499.1 membrane protein insertion efficiency factor YidD [Massilia sp. YIM B02763]